MRLTLRRYVVALTAMLVVVLLGAAQASAASTYTVSGFSDGGGSCSGMVCPSLRAAVTAADANPGSTISLGAGTYTLSSGELSIQASAGSGDALTIVGAGGPAQTVIKQTDGQSRVLYLGPGGPYVLNNVEITDGSLNGAHGDGGGGIAADAPLTLDHVAIVGNSVTGAAAASGATGESMYGGGFFENSGGNVSIIDSTISGNTATAGAGGSGTLNTPGGGGGESFGGGLYLDGQATVVDSTLSGNSAVGGSVTVNGANGGSGLGGGAYLNGTLDLVNSTIAANSSSGGSGGTSDLGNTGSVGNSEGGGIEAAGSPILLLYSDTLDGNTASLGGNLYSGYSSQRITLNNTALADGVATGTSNNCLIEPASGLVISDLGHNFETDPAPSGTSACDLSTADGDLFAGSAKLGPLTNTSGPTETEMPQAGSPLLRAGGSCLDPRQTPAVALTTDQRGEPRGATCDIGAVQVQAAAAVGTPSLTGTALVGQTLTCSPANAFTGEGVSYSYVWLRNGTAIAGQTATAYTLQAADSGTTVTCTVTATSIAGPPVSASASVTVPKPTPLATPQLLPGAPKLVTSKLVDSGGRTKLELRCPAGTSGCAGKLKLTFVVKKTKTKTTTLKLAAGSFKLTSGSFETLALKLSGRVAGLLASHHNELVSKLTLLPSHAEAHTLKVDDHPGTQEEGQALTSGPQANQHLSAAEPISVPEFSLLDTRVRRTATRRLGNDGNVCGSARSTRPTRRNSPQHQGRAERSTRGSTQPSGHTTRGTPADPHARQGSTLHRFSQQQRQSRTMPSHRLRRERA